MVAEPTSKLGFPICGAQLLWRDRHDAASIAMANRSDAIKVSTFIALRGGIVLRWSCSAAHRTPWPLVARRFYLSRAAAKLGYAAPLALADYKFGFKLKSLEARWAIAVLIGRPLGRSMLTVSKSSIATLLSDLGWRSLWSSAAASAVILHWSMKFDLLAFPHTRAMNREDPVAMLVG